MAFLSILASIAVPGTGVLSSRARQARISATLRDLQASCDAFYVNSGRLPGNLSNVAYCLLDFTTADHLGRPFVPRYARWKPADDPSAYGFSGSSRVQFGVTREGRVFATQRAPDVPSGWTNLDDVIYTASEPSGTVLPQITPEAPPLSPAEQVCSIALVATPETVSLGNSLALVARAVDANGKGVAGVVLALSLKGSVSGQKQLRGVTDAGGFVRKEMLCSVAEILQVVVTLE